MCPHQEDQNMDEHILCVQVRASRQVPYPSDNVQQNDMVLLFGVKHLTFQFSLRGQSCSALAEHDSPTFLLASFV